MSEQKTNIENLSMEELVQLRKNRIKHMRDQLEYLKVEEEYSNLKASVAENRLREHVAKVKFAQMHAPQKKQEESSDKSNLKKSK